LLNFFGIFEQPEASFADYPVPNFRDDFSSILMI